MKNDPRVFIPQQPMKRDAATGQIKAVHNLTPALHYGRIVELLPSGPVMLSTKPMVMELRARLRDFNDDDFIVAIGSPSAIAATCMVAAMMNGGKAKLLQFDRIEQRYIPLDIDATGRYAVPAESEL